MYTPICMHAPSLCALHLSLVCLPLSLSLSLFLSVFAAASLPYVEYGRCNEAEVRPSNADILRQSFQSTAGLH